MDKYVEGIVMDYEMDKFLLLNKGNIKTAHGPMLKWQGVGGKVNSINHCKCNFFKTEKEGKCLIECQQPNFGSKDEIPHQAMTREFLEETGYEVRKNRWHCYHLKDYKKLRIYHFIVFMSPDEMKKVYQTAKAHGWPAGMVDFHTLIDLYWAPENYTFDIPYLIQMIHREMKAGMFMNLDPEGTNTCGKMA